MSEKLHDIDRLPWDDSLFFAHALLQLGTLQTAVGEYRSALTELESALKLYDHAAANNPNDTSVNYYLWAANRRLSDAAELSGDPKKGIQYSKKALNIIEGLLATSPKDNGYNRNSAISHIMLGQMYVRHGQAVAALPHFRRALTLSEHVLEADPEYFESKTDLAAFKKQPWKCFGRDR